MKEKMKVLSICIPPDMLEKMKTVIQKEGMVSISDLFRRIFMDYYKKDFRIAFYGHQRGVEQMPGGKDDPITANKNKTLALLKKDIIKELRSASITCLRITYKYMKENGFILTEGAHSDYITENGFIFYKYGSEEVTAPFSEAIDELRIADNAWFQEESNLLKVKEYIDVYKSNNG